MNTLYEANINWNTLINDTGIFILKRLDVDKAKTFLVSSQHCENKKKQEYQQISSAISNLIAVEKLKITSNQNTTDANKKKKSLFNEREGIK